MLQKIRRIMTARFLTAVVVVIGIGSIGSYVLATSNAQTPPRLQEAPSARLLRPFSLGTAPYQYVAYSGSLNQTQSATGIKQYFAAFIVSSSACTPAWGGAQANGLVSPRSTALAADFTALRAAGGDVTVSFGGQNGTDLATSCPSVDALKAAYQSVITTYDLNQLDFDIEGTTLSDTAGNTRRAKAVASLQAAKPDLKIWVTLPVHTQGLTQDGLVVLRELRDQGVVVSGINIMAMNYNIASKDMARQAIVATQSTYDQLRVTYPANTTADIWKAIGITVMIGHNDTLPETFKLADAPKVREFALQKGVGLLSIWNAGRDVACPVTDTPVIQGPSIACSGVEQQPYQYLKALTIPARS